jgi:transcriptional regulator with XRE-family HTH domain
MGSLYERIQSLCESNGIRPGRLCDELQLSRGLITDLKMGRKKSLNAQTAQKIAGYFGVSVGYLLGQEDASAPQNDILDDIDVAFYGEFKELDEQEKETIRDMVRLMRRRRTENQRD